MKTYNAIGIALILLFGLVKGCNVLMERSQMRSICNPIYQKYAWQTKPTCDQLCVVVNDLAAKVVNQLNDPSVIEVMKLMQCAGYDKVNMKTCVTCTFNKK